MRGRAVKYDVSLFRKALLQLPCIRSTRNTQVKIARNPVKHGLMKLEGQRLVVDAIKYGAIVPELMFISENYLHSNHYLHETLFPILAEPNSSSGRIKVLLAAPHVLDAVSDTVSPPGIVALAHIPQTDLGKDARVFPCAQHTTSDSKAPLMSVVCDGISDPGNLGTLIRSAAAAQADAVYCVTPCCNPWTPKVLRAGMGAHFRISVMTGSQADVTRALSDRVHDFDAADDSGPQSRRQQHPIFVAGGSNETCGKKMFIYNEIDWTEPFVLVLGNEAEGPKHSWEMDADDAPATRHVCIPMGNGVESLNVGVAASVILFEAHRQRRCGSGHSN